MTTWKEKWERDIEKPNPEILEKFQAKSQEFLTWMTYYRSALREVETKFQILADECALLNDRNPINDIQTRLKSPQSITNKLQRKGLALTKENIENEVLDVAGVRVVCSPRRFWNRTTCGSSKRRTISATPSPMATARSI